MSRYLAADVIAALHEHGCRFDGEVYDIGSGWLDQSCQVFMLPEPDLIAGEQWFDADVIDDIIRDRWLGFSLRHINRFG